MGQLSALPDADRHHRHRYHDWPPFPTVASARAPCTTQRPCAAKLRRLSMKEAQVYNRMRRAGTKMFKKCVAH